MKPLPFQDSCEAMALAVGSDRKALAARLRDGARTLTGARGLAQWSFDFAAKTLTSPDGRTCVQWSLRRYPDRPICYENQQTSVGTCCLVVPPSAQPQRFALEIRNASGANDSRHDRHYVDGKAVPYERFAAIRSAAMAANTWASLGNGGTGGAREFYYSATVPASQEENR